MRSATLVAWRVFLAAAFLLAAWGKWQAGISHSPFPETIYDRIVRGHAWIHWSLLAVEVCLACWLLTGIRPRLAAWTVILLLLGASLLLLREILSPDPLGCGCGLQPVLPGRGPEQVRQELLLSLMRNVLLLLGALYLAIFTGLRPAAAAADRRDCPPSPPQ